MRENILTKELMNTMELIADNKTNIILLWIMQNLNSNNQIIATQRAIAEATGISLSTVSSTMLKLQKLDVLHKVHSGVYQVNPYIMYKEKKEFYEANTNT